MINLDNWVVLGLGLQQNQNLVIIGSKNTDPDPEAKKNERQTPKNFGLVILYSMTFCLCIYL